MHPFKILVHYHIKLCTPNSPRQKHLQHFVILGSLYWSCSQCYLNRNARLSTHQSLLKHVGEVQISVTSSSATLPKTLLKMCKNISKNVTYFYIVNFSNTWFCQKTQKTSVVIHIILMVFARLLAKRQKLWSWQEKEVLNMENKLTKAALSRQYSVSDSESSLTLCRQGTLGPAAGSIPAAQPHLTWCNPLLFLTCPQI